MSEWQGAGFPFARAVEAGFSFAFLQASVRVAMDARYVENRRRAREVGLLTGSYPGEQLNQRVARACPTRAVRASHATDLSGGTHGLHLFLEHTLRRAKALAPSTDGRHS